MSITTLDKIKLLPADKQKEIEDFVDYLLQKYAKPEEKVSKEIQEKRLRNFGNMKGQIWMAEDFNDTPEDFKEYM